MPHTPHAVYISEVIAAPVQSVWSLMRDFNGMPAYHPGVLRSEIEGGGRGDTVGGMRRLSLGPDAFVREKLLMLDDQAHAFSYTIVEGSLPVKHYVAGVRLSRVTEGDRTFAEWWADFEMVGDADRAHWVGHIGRNIFATAFATIATKLAGR